MDEVIDLLAEGFCGVMHEPQPKLPDWRVAILSITPKPTDPGAIKRGHDFVDRRNVVLSNMSYGDIGSIISQSSEHGNWNTDTRFVSAQRTDQGLL